MIQRIANGIGLQKSRSPGAVSELILGKLRDGQNVVVIVNGVDLLPPRVLAQFIDVFWKPLALSADIREAAASRGSLVMFLTDWGERYSNYSTTDFLDIDSDMDTDKDVLDLTSPFRLPENQSFTFDMLVDWIEDSKLKYSEIRSSGLTVNKLLRGASTIVPEDAYVGICEHFEKDWESDVARCLV